MALTLTIQILLMILLCVSIVAVIRLWSVLGSARVTLANLEATRQEADKTLRQLADVAASTEKVMREEVAPTLQMTRATLEDVHVTTRALAQTTRAVQRMTARAESLTSAQRLLALGGSIAQNVFATKANGRRGGEDTGAADGGNKISAPASGSVGYNIAFAVASRLRGLFARRGGDNSANARTQSRQIAPAPDATDVQFEGGTPSLADAAPFALVTPESPAPGRALDDLQTTTQSRTALITSKGEEKRNTALPD